MSNPTVVLTQEEADIQARNTAQALVDQEKRGTVLNPVGLTETQDAKTVPTNDLPPIPMAPGGLDDNLFSWENDGQRTVSPRIIAPPPPAPREAVSEREITNQDLNSVGYKSLNPSGQTNVENMILRPGDKVAGAVDVYPMNDVSDGALITLMAGAVVPDECFGFLPAHYLIDSKRKAFGKKPTRR